MSNINFGVAKDLDGQGCIGLSAERDGYKTHVWVACPCKDTTHTQKCAQDLLDTKPAKDLSGNVGKTPREMLTAQIEFVEAEKVRVKPALALPTKKVAKEVTETSTDDQGKQIEVKKTVMVDEPVLELE